MIESQAHKLNVDQLEKRIEAMNLRAERLRDRVKMIEQECEELNQIRASKQGK
jgi:chaperonin cofactor prefoldin